MAATAFSGTSLNPISNASTGGTIPSANVIPLVDSWVDAFEPRKTPVWTRARKAGSFNQVKLEWGQSYHVPVSGTTAEALDTTETAITLATGEGKYVAKYDVIEFIDFLSGSTTILDYSTREEVHVDTDPDGTDTINVVRGNGTGTGVSHNSGCYWGFVGNAMPYNRDFTLGPVYLGDKIYNHPQRFTAMAQADKAARRTHSYENEGEDPLLEDFKKKVTRMKYGAERAVVSGQRLTGNAAAGDAALPHKMGGILYFLTNHSGRVTNLSGVTVSLYHLEDILIDMFADVDDGGAKSLLMGVQTAACLDTLLNPARIATVHDDSLNLTIKKVQFRLAELEIFHTQHMEEGQIAFVDWDDIEIKNYDGCQFQEDTDLPTSGPYDKMAIWGDYSVKVNRVGRMGLIKGIDYDRTHYPRNEFWG